jgi:hypothetical protein
VAARLGKGGSVSNHTAPTDPPTYDELRDLALTALDAAIKANCSVCGSRYQQRFFGPEENGFHPRIRHTKHSQAMGNTKRYCGAWALNVKRRELLARLGAEV